MQSAASQSQSLTGRTTAGFAWLLGQSLAGKLVHSAGQIVLAWLLMPQSWGLIGLTYTLSSFVEHLRAMGVLQVLVHRQSSFRRWATAGFWMSAALGVLSMLIMAAAARPVAILYGEEELVGLIIALSLAAPLRGLAVVPEAALQIDLRFGTLALLNVAQITLTTLLTILLALLGCGAYSFVWPVIIVAAVRAAVLWWIARPRLAGSLRSLQLRRWRYMLGDSTRISVARLLQQVTLHGAFIILGIFQPAEVVGLYFFSVNLADQTLRHVTLHLGTVLFPALTRLSEESQRQASAFLRACRLLAIVALPLCFLQAAVAEPFVRVCLADRWADAIPIMQILSLAAALRVVGVPSLSLIQAQGRFGAFLMISLVHAIMMVVTVTAAALMPVWGFFQFNVVHVALAAGVCDAVISQVMTAAALGPAGGTWRDVLRVQAAPGGAGILAVGAGLTLSLLVPGEEVAGQIVRALVVTAVAAPVYLVLIRLASSADCADLYERVRSMLPSRGPRRAPARGPIDEASA